MSDSSRNGAKPGAAIVGMACLFPGASDLDTYWANILGGVDATSDPPPEAWDPQVYYDPEFRDVDRTYCKRGGYLGSLAEFDPLAYGVPPVAVGGEPDQWLALKLAHDALADAGASDLPEAVRQRTAIVLGKGTYLNGGNAIAVQRGLVVGQTLDLLARLHPEYSAAELEEIRRELQAALPALSPETVPGLIPNIIVGRIANRLDLMGPAYTVDAACASSLVAVQHALRALDTGECDLALAGGSQVWMPVATMNLFCRLGALSRHDQLRAFDKDADGTLLGEGIGIVVLKRLEDALSDGDRVYAVIRGVGVASDGRGMSVMAPRAEGEELALRRAYSESGVDPRTVGLVEAHGTGTPVGDVVEVEALTHVFGEREGELPHCALGTVKSMISHTIPAAGVAGLIKVALALYHRVLPPTLHCEEPNPKLGLERTPFYINTETRPWIHGDPNPRRAGINAFGFGGINAHAVLEDVPGQPDGVEHRPAWPTELCVLAAESRAALADEAERLVAAIDGREWALRDLAFSLSRRFEAGEHRLAIVAESLSDLQSKLRDACSRLRAESCERIKTTSGIYYESEPLGGEPGVVLVFPGEGAQYAHMLADLCLHFPPAREVFDRIDRLYADHPRGYRLSDWVFPRPAFSAAVRERNEARLMELDIAVESVLTANAAVYAVVRRLVPEVSAMVGHSTGEHSAAMAAGALDVDTDERLATFCHGLHASYADAAARHEVPGAVLLAVGADAATAQRIAAQAGGELYLAMDNCPHQAVLVGEAAAITRARELAAGEGLMCEELPYDRAVHTPLFAPFAEDLRATFARLPVRSAATALWSCTTAARCPEDPVQIRELLVEHWTRPVRFRETIEALYDDGARVFVEVGPRGNMTAFVQDILRGRPACAVASDLRRRPGLTQLNHLAGMLAAHHVPLELGGLFEYRTAAPVDWQGPAAPRTRSVRLSTTWPMLRLSDDALARLRPAASAHGGDQTVAPPASNGHDHAPLRAPGDAHEPAPVLTSVLTGIPSRPDDLAAAMEQHLQTMARFLDASGQVMKAYLDGAAATAIEQTRLPLLGTIEALDPERTLVARRIVDPSEDRYLLDHTLGRRVSRTDPGLRALALMPLAMTIEMLAEAATCLVPGLTVTGLREVRAHRWLAFGETPRTLELRAHRLHAETGTARVHVELHDLDDSSADRPVAEGIVLLGAGHATAPRCAFGALAEARPARLMPADLYRTAMFHGPMWQGARSLDRVAPGGARAQLQVLPRTGMLGGQEAPSFVLDPVLVDAAGQVIGLWASDFLDRGRVVFPFRVAEVELYGPPRPEGEVLVCQAEITTDGDHLIRSTIEVGDSAGRCAVRLTGWEDKRFDVPAALEPLTRPGELAPMSTSWPGPVRSYSASPVSCRRLDGRLGADRGLWEQVWAGRVLGRRERALFEGLNGSSRRRLEWLAARTAAKDGLAELLHDALGVELLPADIEILPDERGCPVVALPDPQPSNVRAIVSLAHSAGLGVALAALVPASLPAGAGIDIEPLASRPPGFAQAAFLPHELDLLDACPAPARDEWELRLWCAREAAGKAVGTGLSSADGGARIAALDVPGERVEVDAGSRRHIVHVSREDSLIVATTLWRADA